MTLLEKVHKIEEILHFWEDSLDENSFFTVGEYIFSDEDRDDCEFEYQMTTGILDYLKNAGFVYEVEEVKFYTTGEGHVIVLAKLDSELPNPYEIDHVLEAEFTGSKLSIYSKIKTSDINRVYSQVTAQDNRCKQAIQKIRNIIEDVAIAKKSNNLVIWN